MDKRTTADADRVRTLLDDPAQVTVFAWKNVVAFVWHGDATVDLMHKLGVLFEARAREVGPMSVVSIITEVAGLPDEDKRKAYKEFLAAHGTKFAHMAVVFDRKGFLGSAVRGLMTSLLLVSGRQHTLHIMSTIDEVARWLPDKHAAATGVTLGHEELTRILHEIQARATDRSTGTNE